MMYRWFILLLAALGLLSNSMHDVPMATFAINMDTEPWPVKIELDRDDLAQALQLDVPTLETAIAYVQANTSWLLDGKDIPLDLCTFQVDGHHCVLLGSLQIPAEGGQSLRLFNTCLYEIEPQQANIIYLDKGEDTRGFRLHQGRQSTVIDL